MIKYLRAGLLCTAALMAVTGAQAASIDVSWSGTILSSGNSAVDPGDTITGSFTYDDTAPVLLSATFATIYDTRHSSTFTVNGLTGTLSENYIYVGNNFPDLGRLKDQFDTRTDAIAGTPVYTGDLIGGLAVSSIFVRFTDRTGTALSNTDLPSFLDDRDFDNLAVSRLDGADISFFVTTFNFSQAGALPDDPMPDDPMPDDPGPDDPMPVPAPVPLPAAFPLMVLGLGALGGLARAKRRGTSA